MVADMVVVVMAADGTAVTAADGTVADITAVDITAVATADTDMAATRTIMAADTRRTTDMATIQGPVTVLDSSSEAC